MSSPLLQSEMGNVRVYCRVRPHNAKELTMATAQRCVFTDNVAIEVKVDEAHLLAGWLHCERDGGHERRAFVRELTMLMAIGVVHVVAAGQ